MCQCLIQVINEDGKKTFVEDLKELKTPEIQDENIIKTQQVSDKPELSE